MSNIREYDPRTRLVREKYFTLRPKPLEQWLWQQGLPQAAERVFWVHWEEGMRGGDWCSQLSLREVAQHCCIDPSTVTRAYQVLKKLELIRRADPGRDERNPFQQATAVTEVRVPRELLVELSRAPNRPVRSVPSIAPAQASPAMANTPPATPTPGPVPTPAPAETLPRLKYREFQGILGRLSEPEKAAYKAAWDANAPTMAFAAGSALTPLEQRYVLQSLAAKAEAPVAPARTASNAGGPSARTLGDRHTPPTYIGPRRLNTLEAARLRHRLQDAVPTDAVAETFRQVLWAVEEGALRRFEIAMAINIALKKIREGAWSRPNRLPPQWRCDMRSGAGHSLLAPVAYTPRAPGQGAQRARAEACAGA